MSMTRLPFLVLALAFWSTPMKAQEPDTLALNRRVEQLERRVEDLERRVRALEAPSQRLQADTARPASGDWKEVGNWRRLRQGMTMADVSTLLGQPDRVDAMSVVIIWYYGDASGGTVTFDAQSQHVTGWSEPHRGSDDSSLPHARSP